MVVPHGRPKWPLAFFGALRAKRSEPCLAQTLRSRRRPIDLWSLDIDNEYEQMRLLKEIDWSAEWAPSVLLVGTRWRILLLVQLLKTASLVVLVDTLPQLAALMLPPVLLALLVDMLPQLAAMAWKIALLATLDGMELEAAIPAHVLETVL